MPVMIMRVVTVPMEEFDKWNDEAPGQNFISEKVFRSEKTGSAGFCVLKIRESATRTWTAQLDSGAFPDYTSLHSGDSLFPQA
jgi:hypothetical protein